MEAGDTGEDIRGNEQGWWDQCEINGTAILRMRDGQIVEHRGGSHCQEGLGLIR